MTIQVAVKFEWDNNFYRDSHQKELKKWRNPKPHNETMSLEIEFKFACDVIEPVGFGKIYGFYDVTSNFELNSR